MRHLQVGKLDLEGNQYAHTPLGIPSIRCILDALEDTQTAQAWQGSQGVNIAVLQPQLGIVREVELSQGGDPHHCGRYACEVIGCQVQLFQSLQGACKCCWEILEPQATQIQYPEVWQSRRGCRQHTVDLHDIHSEGTTEHLYRSRPLGGRGGRGGSSSEAAITGHGCSTVWFAAVYCNWKFKRQVL